MACGILLVTHPGVGAAILAVATALLRHLPLKAEAFEVPFDADLEALALGSDRIKALLEGKTVRKVIVRAPNLVNIVAG